MQRRSGRNDKGVAQHEFQKVLDTEDVYALNDLLHDNKISEAMLGCLFAILRIKGEKLAANQQTWKARIVLQGSSVRTRTGASAADLFEEVSNAPASFAAARAALEVAALKGFSAAPRDAEPVYLQALIDTPTRTPAFVELPREWWPDDWFHDSAGRTQPKYGFPRCRLLRAFYGHPESGALWEATFTDIMTNEGWWTISGTAGVFPHEPTKAIMVVHIDDMLFLAKQMDTITILRTLKKFVHYKDPEQPLARYLGANDLPCHASGQRGESSDSATRTERCSATRCPAR